MAILIAIFAGLPPMEILNDVIELGTINLSGAIITTIFGAVFAQVIYKTNISTSIIRYVAEFCGDNPILLALSLTFATAFIFTSISGLGSVIMIGTIILPMFISIGINPTISAILLIMGINLGGLFNVANYSYYMQTLKVSQHSIRDCAFILSITSLLIIVLFVLLNVRKNKSVFFCSVPLPVKRLRWYSLISPIIPITLLFVWPLIFKIPINIRSAILIGILYAIITTRPKKIVDILTESFLDGIKDASPAIALMIGIGILIQTVTNEDVYSVVSPIILKIIPSKKLTYVLTFFLLSPLALFRGPLNLFGLGSGIGRFMYELNVLNPLAILGALLSIGAIQGILDPTNTHNIWTANYVNTDTSKILKKALPYVLLQVFMNLIIISVLFV